MQTKKRENALIPVFVPILFLVQNHKSYNILIINRLDVCFLRRTDNYQVTGRTVFRHKKKKRFLTNYSNFTLKEAYFATSKANRRRVRF